MSKKIKKITWESVRININDLIEWQHNPRQIKKKLFEDLLESLRRFGQVDPIAINKDHTIIGGHARLKAMQQLGYIDVDCRRASRLLNDDELAEANIRLNKNIAGEFDFEMLANHFDQGSLIEWGFEAFELGQVDDINMDDAFDGVGTEEKDIGQMKFTVTQEQKSEIVRALNAAAKVSDFTNSKNTNKNANCLAFVCETFNTRFVNE